MKMFTSKSFPDIIHVQHVFNVFVLFVWKIIDKFLGPHGFGISPTSPHQPSIHDIFTGDYKNILLMVKRKILNRTENSLLWCGKSQVHACQAGPSTTSPGPVHRTGLQVVIYIFNESYSWPMIDVESHKYNKFICKI